MNPELDDRIKFSTVRDETEHDDLKLKAMVTLLNRSYMTVSEANSLIDMLQDAIRNSS